MGKKRNNKSDPAAQQTYRKINAALLVAVVVLVAGFVWYLLRPAPPMAADIANLPKPEIETLDPGQFSGQTRLAYQAAKEIPAILSQLPCYCGCMSNFGHKNNLYCFRDSHGVECSMCQDIALDALQMARAGQSLETILTHTRTKFGRTAALNHDDH